MIYGAILNDFSQLFTYVLLEAQKTTVGRGARAD
jgi:hypothetical protein